MVPLIGAAALAATTMVGLTTESTTNAESKQTLGTMPTESVNYPRRESAI